MITTCKCGAPLVDNDDGICEKCFIHQVYEMDRPGPRWQTLAEAKPDEWEVVCVVLTNGDRLMATYSRREVRGRARRWVMSNMEPRIATDADRWHPWPKEGKK